VCLLPECSYSAERHYFGAEESRALFLLTDIFGLLAQTLDSADISLQHIGFNSLWKLADYSEFSLPPDISADLWLAEELRMRILRTVVTNSVTHVSKNACLSDDYSSLLLKLVQHSESSQGA